jgi:hypothetical protein
MMPLCADGTRPSTSIETPPAHQSDTTFFWSGHAVTLLIVLRGGSPPSHNRFAKHGDLFDFLERSILDPQGL